MSTSSQHPSSSSRDLTLLVESESGTPEEYFAQVNLTLGRAKSNTIHIDHPDVDHIHAKVVKREESFRLQCEGQATLQVLEPEPGEVEEVELIPGLTIELGGVTIRCRRQMRGMSSLSDDYWAEAAGGEQFRVEDDSFTGNLPKKIGPYEIRKFVARGGMGIVLRGIHQDTDQPAAVKLPTPDLNKDEEWSKRFEQEVRTLKSVTHPNLVRLQDAGKEGDLHWMAMDWVEGGTVANRIAKAKDASDSIGLYEVKQILLQVTEGLSHLHSRNVVHRDLKPGNLLVGQDGGVKVADFGLAKQVGGEQNTVLTRTGTFAGTMHYMAPEQAEGMDITPAADVYALGVIWHELLTGKKPGVGTLKIRKFRPDCPSGWEEALAQCLDSEPEDRPSLNIIKQALEADLLKPKIDKDEERKEQERERKRKEQERRRVEQAAKRKAELELLAVLESQKKLEKSTQQERRKKEEEQRKQKEEAQRKQKEEAQRRQNKPPVVQRIIAPSPKLPVVGEKIRAEEENPKSKAELLKAPESAVNTNAVTSSGETSQPPNSSPRKDSEQSSDDEGARYTFEPQAHETSSYRKPLIAGIIAIIAGTCVYLWSKAESKHNTLLTVHVRLIELERTYISELNKSTGELGFKSFISESSTFEDELDELSSEPGINIEDLPKEYLNSIASLKLVLYSVNNSARLRHLADLESHDEDRDNLRFGFDEIAENNGLDLSRMPDIPSLLLIQKIKDFERAEESRLLAEKEQEQIMAEMRRRQAEKDRQDRQDRQDATEAERARLAQQLAQRERDALMARINFIRQVKQDFLDAENNYVFFCNANLPRMRNIRFANDKAIAKAKYLNEIGDFQRAVRIGIGKGVFNFATVEKMQRLLKSLDQESIDVQNWNIQAIQAGNKIRLQLRNDISRNW